MCGTGEKKEMPHVESQNICNITDRHHTVVNHNHQQLHGGRENGSHKK